MAEDWNRHFPKDNIKMANRYMKRCSTSLVIREIQIKTTISYYLTPVKMAIIKKAINNKCWQRYEENHTVSGNVNLCNQYGGLLKIELLYDPVIPLLGIHPKQVKSVSHKDMYTHVHCNIIYNSHDMGTT